MKKAILFVLILSFLLLCSCTSKNVEDNPEPTEKYYVTSEQTTAAKAEIKPSNRNNIELYTEFLIERYNQIRDNWGKGIDENDLSEEGFEKDISNWNDVYYFFYDLDNDGLEEMLLGGKLRIGNDIDDMDIPRKICITGVYAVKNNQVVEINDYNMLDQDYILGRRLYSNGYIVTESGYEINPSYYIFAYENGKLIKKCDISNYGDDSYVKWYGYNSRRISNEAEYKQLYETAFGKATEVDIDWKLIIEIFNNGQEW